MSTSMASLLEDNIAEPSLHIQKSVLYRLQHYAPKVKVKVTTQVMILILRKIFRQPPNRLSEKFLMSCIFTHIKKSIMEPFAVSQVWHK